jgi:hypothetical protein
MSRSDNATLLLNWLSLKWCTRYQKFVPRHRNQRFHIQLRHLSDGSRCQLFISLTSRWKRNYKECKRKNISAPSATGCMANWEVSLLTSRRTRLLSSLRQYEHTSRNMTLSQQSYWRSRPSWMWSSVTGHLVPNILTFRQHASYI